MILDCVCGGANWVQVLLLSMLDNELFNRIKKALQETEFG